MKIPPLTSAGKSSMLPKLDNADDVKYWFEYMMGKEEIMLHPDNPFEEYINAETNEPTFDLETASLLNSKMAQAFAICGDQIYRISIDIFKRLFNLNE